MNDLPYSRDIMRHAAAAKGAGRLPAPDATATVVSPVCGDRITIDLMISDGHVTGVSHDARACVLCQASASILASHLVSQDLPALERLYTALAAMLKADEAPPVGTFGDYAVFQPVHSHRSRHKCVLLPVEAALEAMRGSKGTG